MRTFEEELYDAMCEAFFETTVRSISKAMGMSDGYWSSIVSQGLKVSNTALIHLHDHLEVRLIQLNELSSKSKLVKDIQTMIAREIVKRFAHAVEPIDRVWDEFSTVVDQKYDEMSGSFDAMPFVVLRG
jgi:hypothetical protein